jgi:putative FmdB family regulatory protein
MPLYEYKCQSCGEIFEIIQKFSDTPLTVHEKCGGAVERLISTSALMFKGSGWYVNDYGKGNSKDPKPKSTDSNGESKPATGKESSSSSSDSSSKTESSTTKSDTASKTESSPAKSSPSKSDSK